MRTVRVMIAGRVQGVGYRDWLVATASAQGVAGWVRNRADGRVEAMLEGEAGLVELVLAACREGPPAALVTEIVVEAAESGGHESFRRLPTV